MTEKTIRDVAEIGASLGEENGEFFKYTLHTLADPMSGEVGSSKSVEIAALMIHTSTELGGTYDGKRYVRAFLEAYQIEDLEGVQNLIDFEGEARDHYEETLADVKAETE